MFGDTSSQDVADAITAGLEKRRNNTTRGLLGDSWVTKWEYFNIFREVRIVVQQYLMEKEDSAVGLSRYDVYNGPLKFPLQHSNTVFLDLHDHDGPSCCDENSKGSNKRCKLAVEVLISLTNDQTWPIITTKLVTDQTILESQTDSHFHQDPELLQYLWIDGYSPGGFVPLTFTVCSEMNTPTATLREFYENYNKRNDMLIGIGLPCEELG
eukprot:sb/3470205/